MIVVINIFYVSAISGVFLHNATKYDTRIKCLNYSVYFSHTWLLYKAKRDWMFYFTRQWPHCVPIGTILDQSQEDLEWCLALSTSVTSEISCCVLHYVAVISGMSLHSAMKYNTRIKYLKHVIYFSHTQILYKAKFTWLEFFLFYPTLGCDIQWSRAMGISVHYWPRWFQDFPAIWLAMPFGANGAHLGSVPWQKKSSLCVK